MNPDSITVWPGIFMLGVPILVLAICLLELHFSLEGYWFSLSLTFMGLCAGFMGTHHNHVDTQLTCLGVLIGSIVGGLIVSAFVFSPRLFAWVTRRW